MNVDVRAVHFELYEKTREYLNKKLERLAYAKELLVDLLFVFTKEKNFKCECTINFRWSTSAHLVEEEYELNTAIDKLVDKVDNKIRKEKEKIQERKKPIEK
jgi:putative sigma-54 modulation protein